VVGDAKTVTVGLRDGTLLTARVVESNRALDLAILSTRHITEAWLPLLGSVSDREIGEGILIIGPPKSFGSGLTVTNGIVSSLAESAGTRIVQTDAAVSSASGGGPVVLERCNAVIGVVPSERGTSAGGAAAVDATTVRRAYPRRFPVAPPECAPASARGAATSAVRSSAAPLRRPSTGAVLLRSDREPGRAEIDVVNHLARDAIVTLATTAGPTLSFYVRAGERTAISDVREREYQVSYTIGTGWTGSDFVRRAGTFRLDGPLSLEGSSVIVRGANGTTVKPVPSEPWTIVLRPTPVPSEQPTGVPGRGPARKR
jgi:Trypsin-like peptidase domain